MSGAIAVCTMISFMTLACYVGLVMSQGIAKDVRIPMSEDGMPLPLNLRGQENFTNLTIDQLIMNTMGGAQKASDMIVAEDTVLAELDMKLTQEQFVNLYEMPNDKMMRGASRRRRKAVANVRQRWTRATIPYEINSRDFDSKERYWILRAMTEWERYTCVRFAPAKPRDRNRLRIQNGYGCNSQLGMVGGTQALNLEKPGCRWKGLYLHEIGHALGLVHEHQLPTRDNFITINYRNVLPQMRVWFNKYNSRMVNQFGVPYEYSSVMHYGITAFSYDGKSQTIHARNSEREKEIGKVWRKELAFSDVKTVNLMYKCSRHCSKDISCSGSGYVNENCQCVCPDGSSECQKRIDRQPSATAQNTANADKNCTNSYWSSWQCSIWANQGECDRNPQYMKINCRKACGFCGKTKKKPFEELMLMTWGWQLMGWFNGVVDKVRRIDLCKDKFPKDKCGVWAGRGDCLTNPTWMKANCRKACSFCGPGGTQPSEQCQNVHMDDGQCSKWALDGECDVNPVWMRANCRRACRACKGQIATTTVTPTTPSCVNSYGDRKCEEWAKSGECRKNPGWMPINCAKACGACVKKAKCENIVTDELCTMYAGRKECVKNPTWMLKNCRLACGVCKPEGGRSTKAPKCKNKHKDSECQAWAKGGHCRVNPQWMGANCARSCDTCDSTSDGDGDGKGDGDGDGKGDGDGDGKGDGDGDGDGERGNVSRKCVDRNEKCASWAKSDYCSDNEAYMLVHCRKSCNNCKNMCEDVNRLCGTWGKGGHCSSNPSYMLRYCQATCKVCPD